MNALTFKDVRQGSAVSFRKFCFERARSLGIPKQFTKWREKMEDNNLNLIKTDFVERKSKELGVWPLAPLAKWPCACLSNQSNLTRRAPSLRPDNFVWTGPVLAEQSTKFCHSVKTINAVVKQKREAGTGGGNSGTLCGIALVSTVAFRSGRPAFAVSLTANFQGTTFRSCRFLAVQPSYVPPC